MKNARKAKSVRRMQMRSGMMMKSSRGIKMKEMRRKAWESPACRR
jgi:hypothetical protein